MEDQQEARLKRGQRNRKVTYDEGKMKLGFQLGLACGIPSILVSDSGQEVVCNLVTE